MPTHDAAQPSAEAPLSGQRSIRPSGEQSGSSQATYAALDDWLGVVHAASRRHELVDRSLRGEQQGVLTIPIRFGYKVLEVGPRTAFKLGFGVALARIGRR